MPYRLKKEFPGFQVMRQGKFEWRRYRHGQTYDEVPPEDAQRFNKVEPEKAEGRKQKPEK